MIEKNIFILDKKENSNYVSIKITCTADYM